jgi:UDP-glucose 4-epimerase
MHEIMVSEEEANHCVSRGDYLAIRPMIPELQNEEGEETNALTREFSSADTVLDLAGTIELLDRHGLILDAGDEMPAEDELLR